MLTNVVTGQLNSAKTGAAIVAWSMYPSSIVNATAPRGCGPLPERRSKSSTRVTNS